MPVEAHSFEPCPRTHPRDQRKAQQASFKAHVAKRTKSHGWSR